MHVRLTKVTCDRCGTEAVLTEDSRREDGWQIAPDVDWCPMCKSKYALVWKLFGDYDTAFDQELTRRLQEKMSQM